MDTVSESRECAAARTALGPLLLGRLSPEEERATRQHLAACPPCADEARELEPVVARLDRVRVDALTIADREAAHAVPEPLALAAPASLRNRVFASLEGERTKEALAERPPASPGQHRRPHRRRRPLLLAFPAAVAAAVVGLLVFVGLPGTGSARMETRQLVALSGSGAGGTVQVTARAQGTDIDLRASGMKIGKIYGVWVELKSGTPKRVRADTWDAYSTTCHLVLHVPVPLDKAKAVGFSTLDDSKDVARADL